MYSVSVSIDEIIDALADLIEPFVGGAEIIRGQVNRTPPPRGDYVELTEILSVDLAIPYTDYVTAGQAELTGRSRFDVQVDFYGEQSGGWCRAIQNVIRTGYGFDRMPDGIKPLYTDDGRQHPWASGEQQTITRWTLTVTLQYNPVVSVPQQSAVELDADIRPPVDEVNP